VDKRDDVCYSSTVLVKAANSSDLLTENSNLRRERSLGSTGYSDI